MALMLVGFGLKDSIFAIVDIQYGEIQLYDGNVILSGDASEEEKSEVLSAVEADKDVAGAAEGLLTQITVGNGEEWHDIYLDVPKDVDSFPEYTVLQDRVTNEVYQLGDEGAVLTHSGHRQEFGQGQSQAGGDRRLRGLRRGQAVHRHQG